MQKTSARFLVHCVFLIKIHKRMSVKKIEIKSALKIRWLSTRKHGIRAHTIKKLFRLFRL